MTDHHSPVISTCAAPELERHLPEMGDLLHACVHDRASIGFVLPFSATAAEAFWRHKVLPAVTEGTRLLLLARVEGRIVGTAQLDHDTPPNQPHRAEVRKLLVHPARRRQGLARALMAELERQAARLGRSLLTLDTRTDDTAQPLYTSMGYHTAGIIPHYCRDPLDPTRLDATTIMYKLLPPGSVDR